MEQYKTSDGLHSVFARISPKHLDSSVAAHSPDSRRYIPVAESKTGQLLRRLFIGRFLILKNPAIQLSRAAEANYNVGKFRLLL